MWQVLLAAAVAGTGIAAKRLLNPNADPNTLLGHTDAKCIQSEDHIKDLSLLPDVKLSGDEVASIAADESSIFRFSSSESSRYKNRFRSKNVRKKSTRCEFEESEKKCRRLFIRLKKRRSNSSKKASGKFESCSSNDTSSSFSHRLGFGIMYMMMSAGKAEISRLNMTMDETTVKVVHKRKSLYEDTHHPTVKSKTDCVMNPTCFQSEVVEMDLLEAELESELEKLPGCIKDVSGPESSSSTSDDWEKQDGRQFACRDFNGVSALELEKKLSHLLIEQQSSQIVELEDELHKAQSKLFQKEAELRALKNCVKRLTDFSLSNSSSDEQTEAQAVDTNKVAVGAVQSYNCHYNLTKE